MVKVGAFSTADEFIGLFHDHVSDMIINRHNKSKYNDDPANEDIMESLLDSLEEWVDKCQKEDEKGKIWVPDEYDTHDFWNSLKSCYSSVHHWGEWNKEDSQVIYPIGHPKNIPKTGKNDPPEPSEYLGYSDKLVSSQVLAQKSLIKHKYSDKPECIEWNLTEVSQGSKRALIGDAVINEIDAVSTVPWLDPAMTSAEFSRLAPDPRHLKNEWQRVVQLKRIREIQAFANNPENSMFNPITLFVDLENPNVKLQKIKRRHAGKDRYKLKVCFDFLKKDIGKTLTDFVTKPKEIDLRPLWIVDGQHRVRGYAMSHVGFEYRIPVVILTSDPADDARRDVAKIFTEINTLAEPIEEKHQVFLKYRFGIKRDRTDDFTIKPGTRKKDSLGDPDNDRSRVNRRAYELAMHVSSETDSALHNSIQFIGEKGRRLPSANILNIVAWMKHVTPWFRSGSIYSENGTDKFVFEEVTNFFVAFAEACNKSSWPCDGNSGWKDNKNRWNIPPNKEGNLKPHLQRSGPFLALPDFYPKLIEHMAHKMVNKKSVMKKSVSRPISRDTFRKLLKSTSIPNVDWRDPSFKDEFSGLNNTNISHVVMWMMTCVSEKAKFAKADVMSVNKCSKPGKGIRSPPMKKGLNFGSAVTWPKSSQVELVMERPAHTLKANWSAIAFLKGDADGIEFDLKPSWIKTSKNESKLIFKGSDLRNQFTSTQVEKIVVTANWENHVGKSTNSKKTLKRK